MPFISEKKLNKYIETIENANKLLKEQNRIIVTLNEENKHLSHLLGLYEACIKQGVTIDFPNSRKGGNTDNTGTKDSNNIY